MSHQPRNQAPKTLAQRGEDQLTPEEKIFPLRFIVSYVMEKKNQLLALEGQSLHQALALQALEEEIRSVAGRIYGEPEKLEGDTRRLYELLKQQEERIKEITIGLTRKGLAFEDMDNMLRQAQPFILRLLFRDTLTDTYNRYFFISRSAELLAKANPKVGFSLAFLDIDNFKRCNDVYGHEFGDEALKYLCKSVNRHLQACEYMSTYLVRMGGDEFILISNELVFPQFVFLLDDLQRKIAAGTIHWEETRGQITVSIGAANTAFSHLKTPWDVYRTADERLYKAKKAGKNCIVSS